MLNKGQPSIKGVKGVNGREQVTTLDLLICLEHAGGPPDGRAFPAPHRSSRERSSKAFVNGGGRTDEIYSSVVRAVVQAGYSVSGITMPGVAAQCVNLGAVERKAGGVCPAAATCKQSGDFVAGYFS